MTKGIFIGGAAMIGYPSSHRVTIWVENTDEFGGSWDLLMAEKTEILYPAHGKPFAPKDLVRNRDYISRVKIYPLRGAANPGRSFYRQRKVWQRNSMICS